MAHGYCSTRNAALALIAALAAGAGCHSSPPAREQALVRQSPNASYAPSANAQGLPIAPDPRLTPGAVLPVTRDDICVPGYTKKVRNVPEAVKRQVYAAYGITSHKAGDFEVDHLISLELGGSNSPKNLWPESYKTRPWNAHVKDALENRLHEDICTNQIDMATAQREIATNWVGTYKRLFGTAMPAAQAQRRQPRAASYSPSEAGDASSVPAAPSSGAASSREQVWVNTHSRKYFRAGSSHYGTTKQGAYMSEQDAVARGYIAAQGQ